VLGCDGYGTDSGVIAGMDWIAANHASPAVVNMSLGGTANDALDDAVKNLVKSGVTVVVSAGNKSAEACNYSPARAIEAITVVLPPIPMRGRGSPTTATASTFSRRVSPSTPAR